MDLESYKNRGKSNFNAENEILGHGEKLRIHLVRLEFPLNRIKSELEVKNKKHEQDSILEEKYRVKLENDAIEIKDEFVWENENEEDDVFNESDLENDSNRQLQHVKTIATEESSKNEQENSAKKHKCMICDKSFRTSSDRGKHTWIHFGSRKLQIRLDRLEFPLNRNKSELKVKNKKHKQDSIIDEKYRLKLENDAIEIKDELVWENENEEDDVFNESCLENDPNRQLQHVKTIAKEGSSKNAQENSAKKHKCTICDKSFKTSSDRGKHTLIHFGTRNHKCEFCKKAFYTKHSLKCHRATHTGEILYSCNICNRGFKCASNYKNHFLVHSGEKKYQCNICDRKFSLSNNFKRHLNTVHALDRKKVRCEICGRSVVLDSFKQHLQTHSAKPKCECFTCGKVFTEKKYLTNHMVSHIVTRNEKCGFCNKCFKTQMALKKHLRSHDREKYVHTCTVCKRTYPYLRKHECFYRCKFCNKIFEKKNRLSSHLQVHGEKKFQCSICDKAFYRKAHLTGHIKTHTTEKNHNCPTCNSHFVQAASFKSHIQVCDTNRFKCHICDKILKASRSLKYHLQTHLKKDFNCRICNKKFVAEGSYKNHMKRHEKSKIL